MMQIFVAIRMKRRGKNIAGKEGRGGRGEEKGEEVISCGEGERWRGEGERWCGEGERWCGEVERWCGEVERWCGEGDRWCGEGERCGAEKVRGGAEKLLIGSTSSDQENVIVKGSSSRLKQIQLQLKKRLDF